MIIRYLKIFLAILCDFIEIRGILRYTETLKTLKNFKGFKYKCFVSNRGP